MFTGYIICLTAHWENFNICSFRWIQVKIFQLSRSNNLSGVSSTIICASLRCHKDSWKNIDWMSFCLPLRAGYILDFTSSDLCNRPFSWIISSGWWKSYRQYIMRNTVQLWRLSHRKRLLVSILQSSSYYFISQATHASVIFHLSEVNFYQWIKQLNDLADLNKLVHIDRPSNPIYMFLPWPLLVGLVKQNTDRVLGLVNAKIALYTIISVLF